MFEEIFKLANMRRASSWKTKQARTLISRRRLNSEHQIEQVGAKLRAMMPWIAKNKMVDQSKNDQFLFKASSSVRKHAHAASELKPPTGVVFYALCAHGLLKQNGRSIQN